MPETPTSFVRLSYNCPLKTLEVATSNREMDRIATYYLALIEAKGDASHQLPIDGPKYEMHPVICSFTNELFICVADSK